MAEKTELGELIEKYKKEYVKELKALQRKTYYGYKRKKKHVPIKSKQGFLATAVRGFYSDLADEKHDDSNLSRALKFAERYHVFLRFLLCHYSQQKVFTRSN